MRRTGECRVRRLRDIRVVLIRYPVTAEYAAGVVAGMRLTVDRAYAAAGAWDGGTLFIDAFDWNSGDPAYFYDADHMKRRGAAAFGRFLDERLRAAEER